MHRRSVAGLICLLAVGCTAGRPASNAPAGRRAAVLEVYGTVTDERTGRPLADVVVSIDAYGEEAVTDGEGLYRIRTEHRAMDRITGVQAFAPGFLPDERRAQLGCHSIVTPVGERAVCRVRIEFWLQPFVAPPSPEPECAVTGRVVAEEDGVGVAATVRIEGSRLGAVADSSGSYSIPDVPAGLHRASATLLGMVTQRRLVQVRCEAADDPVSLSFRLMPFVIS